MKQISVFLLIFSVFLGNINIAKADELGFSYEVKEEQGVSFETAYKLNLKKKNSKIKRKINKLFFYKFYLYICNKL